MALLGTLADNATFVLDDVYDDLKHKAFLFEYRAQGQISTIDNGDFFKQDGVDIVLVQHETTGAEIDTILTGAEVTDQNMHELVPANQKLFDLAFIEFVSFDNSAGVAGHWIFDLHFKPSSKGGIPFVEGSGWELRFINRTGSALPDGNGVSIDRIYERFAYEGGGGA